MVRHQHARVHFALEALGEIAKLMQKKLVIRLGSVTSLGAIATLDAVDGQTLFPGGVGVEASRFNGHLGLQDDVWK